ncbi:MAG TPA: hypothetical protein VH575_26780 [Gemmataceae bacterium]|jgi:hypothetical protein
MRNREEHGSKNGRVTTNGEALNIRRRRPCYDERLRELRIGEVVVKCFTQKSDGQEIILMAFQEEGWPQVLDDPLTGKEEQDPQQRLRRAVDNLNRRQRVPLLHFGVRGQGTAVIWEFRQESDAKATVERR